MTNRASTLHSKTFQDIVKILVDARTAKGISQSEMARRMKWSQPHMSVFDNKGRNLTIVEMLDMIDIITDGDTKEAAILLKKIQTRYYKPRK